MISRLDLYKKYAGIDLLEIFSGPGQDRNPDLVDAWDYDALLEASQKLPSEWVFCSRSILF